MAFGDGLRDIPLDSVFETLREAVLVLDRDLLVVAASRSFYRRFALTPEQAIGRSVFALGDGDWDIPALRGMLADVASTGAAVDDREIEHHFRLPGHRILLCNARRVDDNDAGLLMLAIDDVTARRQAEATLRGSEARLRAMIETAVDGIMIIDAAGRVLLYNAAAERIFGHAGADVVGNNVSMLMPTPDREQHDGYLRRYKQTGERGVIGVGREVTGMRRDGSTFPMDLSVGEYREDGEAIFVGVIRDLTERHETEATLRQAQRMEAVGQLTGGIAHDFNNLLTVVTGNLEMLEMRAGDDDRLQRLIRPAMEAAELGADLTGRLLAFGRRQPLEQKVMSLNDMVLSMTRMLRSAIGEAVQLSTVLAGDLGLTNIDSGQFENALLNLAINARDAMADGGSLVIETTNAEIDETAAAMQEGLTPGDYVMVAVSDTGAGMTPETRARAFEPFFTTKGAGAGTGLGLSMVYGFARQSNGHAVIYSEAGIGTTVKLYFPRLGDTTDVDVVTPAARETPRGDGEIILVVEDDARVRRVTLARLRELGYRTAEAEDGPAALAHLETGADVDLLFTDIVMPGGLTGLDVAKAARRRRPELKVLLTSGYAEPAILTQLDDIDSDSLLRKPHSLAELATKVRRALAD